MNRQVLLESYRRTRALSLELCEPLQPEDYRVQSMADVSPPWWNLGHTTWFFCRNILKSFGRYVEGDERLEYVLNSYYESLGPRLPRHQRGLVTRPTTEKIFEFRRSVDQRMEALLQEASEEDFERLEFLVATGIQHEQQHQELFVTEIKHILGSNTPSLREAYRPPGQQASTDDAAAASFVPFEGGLFEFGNLEGGWCWDNETPIHKAYLEDFALFDRLITQGEYLEFVEDGGYASPLLWLSNGWAQNRAAEWAAPLYWEKEADRWQQWTLGGLRDLQTSEPVSHVSFYEADAFVRWKASVDDKWAGARLPTEREWEQAARASNFTPGQGNFLESGYLHPQAARPAKAGSPSLRQLAGDLWEWTSNHYEPYPGYRPFEGDLMEYNGKFMDNQRVLRGGSCATPGQHIRASYRNFWPAGTRFQFAGIRPAKGLRKESS